MAGIRIPQTTPQVRPQVGQTVAPEAPRAIPQQNLQPEQQAQLAQGLQAAGTGALRAADYLQDARDDATSQDLYNEFATGSRQILQAQTSLKGKAAIDAQTKSLEALAQLRETIGARTENANQQRMFDARANVHQEDVTGRIEGWGIAQTKAFEAGATEAGLKGSTIDYQTFWQNPEKAATYAADVKAKANKRADQEGDSDEMRRLRVLNATTEMHVGVIDGIVDTNARAANDYYAAHKSEMTPAAQNRAEGELKNGLIAQKSREIALRAEAAASVKGGSLLDQQDYALAAAEATHNGKLLTDEEYDATVRRIRERYSFKRSENAQRVVEAYNSAEDFLSRPENRNLGVDALDAKTKRLLQENGKWDSLLNFAKAGRQTDPVVYARLWGMTRQQQKDLSDQEFAESIAGSVSPVQAEKLWAKRNALLGKAVPGSTTAASRSFYNERAARQLGILPTDPETPITRTQKDAEDEFQQLMRERVQAEEAIKGKQLTDDEYRKFVDTQVLEQKQQVTVPTESLGNLFLLEYSAGLLGSTSAQRELRSLSPEERAQAYVTVGDQRVKLSALPKSFIERTTGELRDAGMVATFQNIADMWLAQGRPAK